MNKRRNKVESSQLKQSAVYYRTNEYKPETPVYATPSKNGSKRRARFDDEGRRSSMGPGVGACTDCSVSIRNARSRSESSRMREKSNCVDCQQHSPGVQKTQIPSAASKRRINSSKLAPAPPHSEKAIPPENVESEYAEIHFQTNVSVLTSKQFSKDEKGVLSVL
ncbi:hypothetical protein Ciccas_001461 [Cichlidogyrus casuarinus]|uniref:Uncharacterized protein n=1 Tax=Cichlidogyrus casuarinus TaxID=1844966 RepID=A0ABD2QK95_9PLAT